MHLQPRRKLREWCNRLTPARQLTSPPLEGVGRCVTLWCGLHVPHPPMLGCHARWWSCRGHSGWVLLSAAGVWSFSKPWRPQGGQAGDQSGQRSHLVESSLGKEAKCARSGVVRARGRRPDQPRRTPRPGQGKTRGTWGLMGPGCRYVCGPTSAACLGLWVSVGLSQALLSCRGPPGDSRRWWAERKKTTYIHMRMYAYAVRIYIYIHMY